MRCGKHTYRDRRSVISAINVVMRRRKNRPKMLRPYYCDQCQGWHLTKQEKREQVSLLEAN
jgi:hypothetical protein